MSEAETMAAAMALSAAARAELALRLVESLDDPAGDSLSPAEWKAAAREELDRRWVAAEGGEVTPVPVAEGLAQVRDRLRRAR